MKSYLKVRCNKEQLATIRSFVHDQLQAMQVPAPDSDQIVLAVDEACANCMIHQHQCDGYSTIEVAIYKEGDTLYTEIKDTGSPFSLDTYQPRQLSDIVRSRSKGGLGIALIHKIMDVIKVEEGIGFYIYKLGKKLDGPAPGASGRGTSSPL
ncbi:MAG: ATP-binding protein [Bacteroidia bacterium]|jgi:serine/threonine-protein kinase RsbW|nr:ATP-binding protein [Bacteroidia bacterium]